jgi:ubiquinone biosynthesis protein
MRGASAVRPYNAGQDPKLEKVRQQLKKERDAITKGARQRKVISVLAKHGVVTLLKGGIKKDEESLRKLGQRLRLAFEELGPTYIKLGQVLVTRQEFLPPEITEELAKLLDDVPPAPFEQMQVVLEDELPEGLGTFRWIMAEPIGSASLAQVYRAQLWDGTDVAVKVVRPNVDKLFQTDISSTRKLVKSLQKRLPIEMQATSDLVATINDYYSSSMSELDMVQEAQNMEQARRILEEGKFERIRIPKVYMATPRVLITEYIDGWSIWRTIISSRSWMGFTMPTRMLPTSFWTGIPKKPSSSIGGWSAGWTPSIRKRFSAI